MPSPPAAFDPAALALQLSHVDENALPCPPLLPCPPSPSEPTQGADRAVHFSDLCDSTILPPPSLPTSSKLTIDVARDVDAGARVDSTTDILQFNTSVYFCMEGEGVVQLQIDRLGSAIQTASVEYFTKDGSALAGRKYVHATGKLDFVPGETSKTIEIQIVEDEAFDTTLEFEVVLCNPVGVLLATYLSSCHVYIADNDAFPTNKFQAQLSAQHLSNIPQWLLFVEYLRMTLRDQNLRRKCYKTLVGDQFVNLNYVYAVQFTNYLIDHVLNPPDGMPPNNAMDIVFMFLIIYVLLVALVFVIDRWKAKRRIKGYVTSRLQSNLLRKFMNYNEASRNMVSTSDLTTAITRDAPELVEGAFMTCFSMAKNIGLLIVLTILTAKQLAAMSVWFSCLLFIVYPLLMLSFVGLRYVGTASRRKMLFQRETDIVGFIQELADCYQLIADALQKPAMVNMFSSKIKHCSNAGLDAVLYELTNRHFAPLLSSLVVSLYIIITAQRLIDGKGRIGEFITGIALCKGIGFCFQSLYLNVLAFQMSIAPLINIVHYMNLPVDVLERMKNSRDMLDMSKEQLEHAAMSLNHECEVPTCETKRDSEGKLFYAVDLLKIMGRNLSYAYPEAIGGGIKVLDGADFEVTQGKLVAVTGPRGSGKATLLQLLGGVIIPAESGTLFVPPHLRVLHVGYRPQVVSDLDLFENLCFGTSDLNDEAYHRVLHICKRLGMSDGVLSLVRREAHVAAKLKDGVSPSVSSVSSQSVSVHTNPEMLDVKEDSTHHTNRVSPFHLGTLMHQVSTRTKRLSLWDWDDSNAYNNVEGLANEGSLLSNTDKCLLHLARALVMNPDVLVMHKPLEHFDDEHARHVLELLREFVNERGIERPSSEASFQRRPRTCIFSTSTLKQFSERVDLLLHVADGKIQILDRLELESLKNAARQSFSALDADGDGRVNKSEFVQGVKAHEWLRRSLGGNLDCVFMELDHKNSGNIDVEDVIDYLECTTSSATLQKIASDLSIDN